LQKSNKGTGLIISIEFVEFLLGTFLCLYCLLVDRLSLFLSIISRHGVAVSEHCIVFILLLWVRLILLVHGIGHRGDLVAGGYDLGERVHIVGGGCPYGVGITLPLLDIAVHLN
jgi:hypothetical protein